MKRGNLHIGSIKHLGKKVVFYCQVIQMISSCKKMPFLNEKENILIYTKKISYAIPFSSLKNKLFLYHKDKKKLEFNLMKHFYFIESEKDIRLLKFLHTIIVFPAQKNLYDLVTEMLANIPKLKKIILIENKGKLSKFILKTSKDLINQFDLKVVSKKKFINSDHKKKIYLFIRRKRIPNSSMMNSKKFVNFFFIKFKKKIGAIIKDKNFLSSVFLTDYFNLLNFSKNPLFRINFIDNLQKIYEELGLLSFKFYSFKTKDWLYFFSHKLVSGKINFIN